MDALRTWAAGWVPGSSSSTQPAAPTNLQDTYQPQMCHSQKWPNGFTGKLQSGKESSKSRCIVFVDENHRKAGVGVHLANTTPTITASPRRHTITASSSTRTLPPKIALRPTLPPAPPIEQVVSPPGFTESELMMSEP